MTLKLIRQEFREDGIFSELRDESGKVLAHTLEHSYNCMPKLYDGEFTCVRGIHRLHNLVPFETFMVSDVKGHAGILMHPGNWNKDSDGCILVGLGIAQSNQGQMLTQSLQAFTEIMDLLKGLDSFILIVQT
jgi:hypothetical protein